jgi:hypothetical protein
MISLDDQIKELQRELALRDRVYPHLVANGKLRQPVADRNVARMRAAMATLRDLRQRGQLL